MCHVAALLLLVHPAFAAVVYKKGATQPIAGYLVRENESEVVLRQPQPDGRTEDVVISRSEIADLLYTVDPARLAALDPARPQDYREYADELSEKKLDPEARDAALRLYVIAAHVGQGSGVPDAGHAAMLGLIALARSPAEEARFRAAAYLADPRHDASVLRPPSAMAGSAGPANPAAQRKLLDAVQLVRRGKGDVAARMIGQQPEVAAELAAARSIVSKEDFLRICRTRSIDDGELKILVKLELALETALSPPEPSTSPSLEGTRFWSELLSRPQPPLKPLALEHLTEFDPKRSVYRDGKWVEP